MLWPLTGETVLWVFWKTATWVIILGLAGIKLPCLSCFSLTCLRETAVCTALPLWLECNLISYSWWKRVRGSALTLTKGCLVIPLIRLISLDSTKYPSVFPNCILTGFLLCLTSTFFILTLNIHWKDWCWSWSFGHLMRRGGKDPHAGKDWGREKGTTEDEMVGWHHQLSRHEFEQTLGDGEGQGSLACCSPWSCKESDTTERPNNSSNNHQAFGSQFLISCNLVITQPWTT